MGKFTSGFLYKEHELRLVAAGVAIAHKNEIATSSAACRIPNPKRTFRVPLEFWLSLLPRSAGPLPGEQGQCHGGPSASIGYRASLFQALSLRHGPERGPHL